jgi:hypothetical protein
MTERVTTTSAAIASRPPTTSATTLCKATTPTAPKMPREIQTTIAMSPAS